MKRERRIWSTVLYLIALLACFTGLGFFIATAAGASAIFVNIGIWLIVGGIAVAIIARAITGRKLID